MGCGVSAISTEAEIRQRRSRKVYRQVSESYDALNPRRQRLKEGRTNILRYKPGDWIDVARGVSTRDFHVPSATTLLLIGPRGSGKSTLVNTISQFFENEGFTARRAQVSNNAVGEGTLFLSFKDDKPAVVITHGDLLPLVDRVQVRIDLGRLLGIPPDQVFDISENNEPGTNLAIIDLLSHSLQRADRNLPLKSWFMRKVGKIPPLAFLACLMLLIGLLVAYIHTQG